MREAFIIHCMQCGAVWDMDMEPDQCACTVEHDDYQFLVEEEEE